MINVLPSEIFQQIILLLDLSSIYHLTLVCKYCSEVVKISWKNMLERDFDKESRLKVRCETLTEELNYHKMYEVLWWNSPMNLLNLVKDSTDFIKTGQKLKSTSKGLCHPQKTIIPLFVRMALDLGTKNIFAINCDIDDIKKILPTTSDIHGKLTIIKIEKYNFSKYKFMFPELPDAKIIHNREFKIIIGFYCSFTNSYTYEQTVYICNLKNSVIPYESFLKITDREKNFMVVGCVSAYSNISMDVFDKVPLVKSYYVYVDNGYEGKFITGLEWLKEKEENRLQTIQTLLHADNKPDEFDSMLCSWLKEKEAERLKIIQTLHVDNRPYDLRSMLR